MGRRLGALALLAFLAFGCGSSTEEAASATPPAPAGAGAENHAGHGQANPNGQLAQPGSKLGG